MIEIKSKEELQALLNKYKCYATDYDGTIIDSMQMWNEFARKYVLSKGKELINDIDSKIKYLSNYDAAVIIHNDYNILNNPLEVYEDINKFVEDIYPTIKLKKGSDTFLDMLDKSGKNLLSSATPESLLRLSCEALGIIDKYKYIYSSSDLKKSKESCELFKHIIECEGIDKGELLVIEDSILAMKACYNEGIDTLIVADYSNKDNYTDIVKYATYFVDLSIIL